MIRSRRYIDKALEILLILLMAALVIDVVWQVLARYVVKSPSSFTDELARFLLIWVGLFGSAYALGKKKHLAIDILPSKLKPKAQKRLRMFINLLVILFALTTLVIGGTRLVYITLTLDQISAALGIPLGYIYLSLPISGLLMVYYGIAELLEQ